METLTAPPTGGVAGYPGLHGQDPAPPYGPLNPRPGAADVQAANASNPPAGPLFGEFVTANSDASLFQPNISPDVVTVAVEVPDYYFNNDRLYVPGGTTVLLTKEPAAAGGRRGDALRRQARHTGCLYTALLGPVPGMRKADAWTVAEKGVYAGTRNTADYATVTVGPATAIKGKLLYMAVAVQNVCSVSAACVHRDLWRDRNLQARPRVGSRLYIRASQIAPAAAFNHPRDLPLVRLDPATPWNPNPLNGGGVNITHAYRTATLLLPLDTPGTGTASLDLGRHHRRLP